MQIRALLVWVACVVAGAYALISLDPDLWFLGAAVGAFLGWVILWRPRGNNEALERRVAHLEATVARLNEELRLLAAGSVVREGLAPGAASEAAQPLPGEIVSIKPAEPVPAAETVASVGVDQAATKPRPESLESPATRSQNIFVRVFYGSTLAKVGAALLLIAVGSLLKLGAEYLQASIEARLGGLAALAIALAVFGWLQRSRRPWVFETLTAAGFAGLYLLAYFMWAGYRDWAGGQSLIGGPTAFALLAAIAWSCTLLGFYQNRIPLTLLGLLSAFAAPLLAGAYHQPQELFSYYILLDVLILVLGVVRNWRYLNVLAFALTVLAGIGWATRLYQPAGLTEAETFLVLFFILFSLGPVVYAMVRGAMPRHPADLLLIFGAPLASMALQAALIQHYPYALAASAFIVGLYYFGLCFLLRARPLGEMQVMEQMHSLIGAALVTLAVPLAFGPTLTALLLVIEGTVLVWAGMRLERRLFTAAGLAIELAAALYFLIEALELQRRLPISNEIFAGCVVFAIAGFATSHLLRKHAHEGTHWARLATPAAIWGAVWGFGGAASEIVHFAPRGEQSAALLAFFTVFALGMEWLGARIEWHRTRIASALFPYLVPLLALTAFVQNGHVLDGWMLWVFPAALAAAYWILRRHEWWQLAVPLTAPHMALAWLIYLVLTLEWVFYVRQSDHALLWQLVAWGANMAIFAMAVSLLCIGRVWPMRGRTPEFIRACGVPAVFAGLVWVLYANAASSGAWGFDYVPVFNPLDVASTLFLAVGTWMAAASRHLNPTMSARLHQWMLWGLAIGKFWWANMTVARTVHHYGGVPYTASDLMSSLALQAILSIVWTIAALAVMVWGTRASSRNTWFVGFGLLAIVGVKMVLFDLRHLGTASWTFSLLGVAILVIAAGYFTPTPPRQGIERA